MELIDFATSILLWTHFLLVMDTASLVYGVTMLRKNLQFELYNVGRLVQGKDIFLQAISHLPTDIAAAVPPSETPAATPQCENFIPFAAASKTLSLPRSAAVASKPRGHCVVRLLLLQRL